MYGIIKKAALLILVVSMQAIALNDSEEMEFVGAVNDGDIKIVQRYVETMNVNLEDSYFAWTPFLMSAAKNQMEVMRYLKDNGANMNYTHPVTRFNALHHAAFNGNKEMVKYLIDLGIEQKNLKGNVTLIRALNEDNKKDMAEFLISLGMKNDGCQEERCF